ncbi:MAG: ISAzo13 family transposase [Deltaproteobacteria bacterium]|jgi:hypothetical protein|nr:ISAzo13 family transposase [Deltaproteobacteria bacterium]
MDSEERIRHDFELAKQTLNERTLRAFVAERANSVGYGGVTMVHRATGVARSTIKRGLQEIRDLSFDPSAELKAGRIRRSGGGRIPLVRHYPGLNVAIETILEPCGLQPGETPPLKWTLDSTRKISARLKTAGLDVSPSTARKQLKSLGYTLQTTCRHMLGDNQHPDGNAQFSHINDRVGLEIGRGNPVLSVESRRLVKGECPSFERFKPRPYPGSNRAISVPRGLYDLSRLRSGSEIDTDRADSEFTCHSILGWWKAEGRSLFESARQLYVTVGRGGCTFNSKDVWRSSVFELGTRIKVPISISHFQPGTSRWDPELCTRLFSFLSTGWHGDPFGKYETSVTLLSGRRCVPQRLPSCLLNHGAYSAERSWEDLEEILDHTDEDGFQGEWNYTVMPGKKSRNASRRLVRLDCVASVDGEGE